jgi:sporulation protein YlmC with PRC-barrel domain
MAQAEEPAEAEEPAPETAQAKEEEPAPEQQQVVIQQYVIPVDQLEVSAGPDGNLQAVLKINRDNLQQYSTLQNGELPQNMTTGAQQLMLASQFIQYTIMGRNDNRLGRLEDMMLNVQEKRLAYFAFSPAEQVLGIAENTLFAVPLHNITGWSADEKRITVDIAQGQLNENYGFEGDNWPSEPSAW